MPFFTSPAFLLAIIFVIATVYSLYAKVRDSKAAPEQAPAQQPKAQPVATPVAAGPEIVGADDKTAAVIMALVSHQTGIPLNRLSFKSIRLMEDK